MEDLGTEVLLPPDADVDSAAVLQRLLRAVREHLDLDVAFVGEVVGNERVFRHVDSGPGIDILQPGDSDPVGESYCGLVLDGRLPQYIPDPAENPVAAKMPVTSELPVGTHLSVPIQFSDGRTYGTFCVFALDVKDNIAANDLRALEMMADLAGEYLEAIDAAKQERRRIQRLVQSIIDDPAALAIVFQPLRDLETMEIVGLEALARFPQHPLGPAPVFAGATEVGMAVALEMRAVRAALDAFSDIPAPIRLNINVSPETLYSTEFYDAVRPCPTSRLVVEVTEHTAIDDYSELKAASASLRDLGIWLAIDDVGMGFSGLTRILETSPHELKLDAAVIRDVDVDPVKQALVDAFRAFGERAKFNIVAEGIETQGELDMLRDLGVQIGQGYHLGRPTKLAEILSGVQPHP